MLVASAIEALIFDMDGVLIQSEHLAQKSEREVCRQHGIMVPKTLWNTFKGMRSRDVFERIVRECTDGSFDVDALTEERRARYLELAEKELRMFYRAREVLAAAERRFKSKLALVTSSSPASQEQVFRKFDLNQFFAVVIAAVDVLNGKPHPEAYVLAAKRLGVPTEKTAVIEDSDNGIRAACAAGCHAIGITHTFSAQTLWDAGADEVISRLPDLYGLFRLS